jgi:DNA repair protein RadD
MSASPQAALALGQHPVDAPCSVPIDWLDALPPQIRDCLRDYQRQQIADVVCKLHSGHTRILAQAPTGAGKTHIIAAIVSAAFEADLRVLVLATRTRLVRQMHERLESFGVRHGVIAAPLPQLRNYSAKVQVASVDTLNRRALVNEHIPLPAADIVIFDEAHLATAETRLRLLDSYPSALRIGFSATPARKSGRSLGAAFDCLIIGPSIRELTAAGVLVPTRIFNTPIVTEKELRAVPKDTDRDFRPAALGELLSRPKLIGDVVTNWLRIANRKRTLCFAANKAHGASLLHSFIQQGVAAEMLTDADDEETREEIIGRLQTGATSVIINCFLMSYGVDLPTVECIVIARPTLSLMMYLQMVGRGLRAAPGKTHCMVIDHGHVVENLGLPQSDHDWTLAADRNVNAEALARTDRKSSTERARTCGQCAALWLTSEQGHACPECGWTPPQRSKAIGVEEADLNEIADDDAPLAVTDKRVLEFHAEACGWYARRWPDRWRDKPSSGRWWAWAQTLAKFGFTEGIRMPDKGWKAYAMPASAATAGWLRHRLIKWAKSNRSVAA